MAYETGSRRLRLLGFAALAIAALATSCAPAPDPDDEGHATFAREAIKAILGRPARGVDEVEAVADIAQLLGRDVAARMLMEDDEFVAHWSDVLVDVLDVYRSNITSAGLGRQEQACWAEPTLAEPDPAIAEWVRDHSPLDAGANRPEDWNMGDLLGSAVAADDLSVIYRVNLFPLMSRFSFSTNLTAELAGHFNRIYLDRDVACLRCHNPAYSASNKTDGSGNIVWQRTFSVPGHPEKALYGNYYDAAAVIDRMRPVFRTDVRNPSGAPGGILPWGISQECVREGPSGSPTFVGFRVLGAAAPGNPQASFGSLDGAANPRVSVWELEAALAQGIADLEDGYERLPASAPVLPPDEQSYCDVVAVFSGYCTACHAGNSPPGGLNLAGNDPAGELINVATQSGASTHAIRVVPNSTGTSELWERISTNSMPPGPGGIPNADKITVSSWISSGAPATASTEDCNTSPIPDVHPDEALAFLVASKLVHGIWAAAMGGSPLNIDHGYSRNGDQLHMLWNLTEHTLIKEGWSLKAVLTKIVTSDWFARRAPSISQENTGYELHPILDPWIVADPTVTPNPPVHERMNGQGELVDRGRVVTLMRQLAVSLGWREPERYPGGGYPARLSEALGQGYSLLQGGFDGVNFQSLLALEDEVGLCTRSGHAEGPEDYLDALSGAVVAFNAANPAAPITIGEMWSALKDRIVQDPTIETSAPSGLVSEAAPTTELEAFVAFVNAELEPATPLTFNSGTDTLTPAQIQEIARAGCAVLLKTPFVLLTHLTPRGYSDNDMPDPPRLSVCLPGESCGYAGNCAYWRSRLWQMGHHITCEDRTVRKGTIFIYPGLFGTLKLAEQIQIKPVFWGPPPTFRGSLAAVDTEAVERATRQVAVPPRRDPGPIVPGPTGPGPIRPVPIDPGPIRPGPIVPSDPSRPNQPPLGTGVPRQPSSATLVVPRDRAAVGSAAAGAPGSRPVDRFIIDLENLTIRPMPEDAAIDGPQLAIGDRVPNEKPLDFSVVTGLNSLSRLQVQMDVDMKPTPLDRSRQRVESLCLDGICGFVRRRPVHLGACLRDPSSRSCDALRPLCDPRHRNGDLACGAKPTDYRDSGVLVVWAEGAAVQAAEGVRLLRGEIGKWVPLRGGERLMAGDLLFLPPTGRIEIEQEGIVFGDRPMEREQGGRVEGTMIAIVGESSERRLAQPSTRGALSLGAALAGSETMRFQSGALDRELLQRSITYGARPESRPTLTLEQIRKLNENFDALHQGLEPE